MATLQDTPSANRLHIGVFGKTNSGKSTLVNGLTGQQMSIVSDIPGTTTDPVQKAMEIHPLGPCVVLDTPGFNDTTELGEARVERTRLVAEKTDIAVVVFSAGELVGRSASKEEMDGIFQQEKHWIETFINRKKPVLGILNKIDLANDRELEAFEAWYQDNWKEAPLPTSMEQPQNMDTIKEALARKMPEDFGQRLITGDLVGKEDVVLLVMPQDIQAPKGRLILPQVQTLRELLDKKCIVLSVTTDQLEHALVALKNPPKLIITDSQVFGFVYEHKPAGSMLTSFSVLFAAYKGDLPYYLEGAKAIDSLTPNSSVLIAECCTHAPLQEDIGRVKIPRMLQKRYGASLTIDHVSGTDFPKDLSDYDLIIQCGACMFNRTYVMARVDRAKRQQVPMTNYGVTIAHLTGILDKVVAPS